MQSYFPPSPNPLLTTTSSSNITGLTLGLIANTLTSQRNVLLPLDTPGETWHLNYLSVHSLCLCLHLFFCIENFKAFNNDWSPCNKTMNKTIF